MPPSVNKLYKRVRNNQIALTEEARQYRNQVKKLMASRMADISAFPAGNQEVVYRFTMVCYFTELENPGWFEVYTKDHIAQKDKRNKKTGVIIHQAGDILHKKGERKAKARYKEIDVDNRVKFAQDTVIKGLGIPSDSQVFENVLRKHKCPVDRDEHILVIIQVMDPKEALYGSRQGGQAGSA